MKTTDKILVLGHRGLVGSHLLAALQAQGYTNLITRTRSELNLIQQADVEAFFAAEQPDYVFMAAAKVGGILANDTYRAQFIYENLMIQSNVIHAAHVHGVKKLLFIGSSCIYPKLSEQPIQEKALLTGPLEPTNRPYALAKIAGIEMCQSYYRQYGDNFISIMPSNLYGPNDHFELENSHVVPALIRKFYDAVTQGQDTVTLWGSGTPQRELLYVEDMADGAIWAMNNIEAQQLMDLGLTHINVGSGEEITIAGLAELIAEKAGFQGTLVYDTTKPDGTPRKIMDVSIINQLGWTHQTSIKEGIHRTYDWFMANIAKTSDLQYT